MLVLGIETSCDDTSVALYSRERGVVENLTAQQLEHERYGGVVPEIASRQHIKALLPAFDTLLERSGVVRDDIDGVAVSNGPGLVGSLLVGVGFAKSLAYGLGIPVVGVHHIEAHILSNELDGQPLQCPCVVLVVSGGHTILFHVEEVGRYHVVGSTRDDAAGEAFDKIAKLLGLGFPGGPAIQEAAESGSDAAADFPRAMKGAENFDFSFSGLKTAVRLYAEQRAAARTLDDRAIADISASAQRAIVDVLVQKTTACARKLGVRHVYIAGGVAANALLRKDMQAACAKKSITFHAPLLSYCTDNAAMVALAGSHLLERGANDGAALDVFARGQLTSWME